jgi:hypothetical protein
MPRKQIEDILGGSARQEVKTSLVSSTLFDPLNGAEEWWGEEGIISVKFDATGKVNDKLFSQHRTLLDRPNLAAKVRCWLPW